MILVTRLNGSPFAVNPDLLERVETTPDTVLTLIDGTKYLVTESVAEVIGLVRDFRASVVVAARFATADEPPVLDLLEGGRTDADEPGLHDADDALSAEIAVAADGGGLPTADEGTHQPSARGHLHVAPEPTALPHWGA